MYAVSELQKQLLQKLIHTQLCWFNLQYIESVIRESQSSDVVTRLSVIFVLKTQI